MAATDRLAAHRRSVIAEIAHVGSDSALTSSAKVERVNQLQHSFRAEIKHRLGLTVWDDATIDLFP